ncbi:MAG: hypothetical protein ABEJ97_03110 [Halobellus sp.]
MQIHPPPESDAPRESTVSDRPPVGVTVTTEGIRGVALVRVELHSDVDADVRVRISNRLDGPVLPPRTEGVPASGWDDEGFSGRLPADGTLGVGYACPAVDGDSVDPVAVELLGPSDATEPGSSPDVGTTVRDLGRAVPPADAVPADPAGVVGSGSDRTDGKSGESDRPEPSIPDALSAWFDAVTTRVERAERLTDASAVEAVSVLEACDGPAAAAELPDRLEADAAALRATLERVERLVSRAEAADPDPVASALAAGAEALSDPRSATGATSR